MGKYQLDQKQIKANANYASSKQQNLTKAEKIKMLKEKALAKRIK